MLKAKPMQIQSYYIMAHIIITNNDQRSKQYIDSPYKLLFIKYKPIHIPQWQGHYCLIMFTIQVPVKILLAIAIVKYWTTEQQQKQFFNTAINHKFKIYS